MKGTDKGLLEQQCEYGNEIVPILAFFSYKQLVFVSGKLVPTVKLSITRKSFLEELNHVFKYHVALFGIHLFISLAAPVAWSAGARLL